MHSSVYNKIKTKCIIPDIPVWSSHETHKEDTVFSYFLQLLHLLPELITLSMYVEIFS